MSTADADLPVATYISGHPDTQRLDRVRDAIDWWLSQPPPESATNSLTGGGAIAALERAFSAIHDGRPALLMPSATYGLRLALAVVGVARGDEVLLPAVDWTASTEAVTSLGARPVPVDVAYDTLTIDPNAAARARTDRTKTVIACHLHGVCSDVPALRDALPGLPIIEDCAAALGSRLDGRLAGTLADLAVFSFGPGKMIDAGEGGMLLSSNRAMHETAVTLSSHPLRQALTGVPAPRHGTGLQMRPEPLMAIYALYLLRAHRLSNPASEPQLKAR